MRDLDDMDWLSTKVPSSVFGSLIKAGKINEGELNRNPEKFAPISEKPWVYRKTFDLSAELSSCNRIVLVFEGLDTVAKVWLNDKLIGKPDNMFIRHRYDVSSLLKPTGNCLLVKFEPAVAYARRLVDRYGKIDTTDFSNACRVYIRKAQYQFGWDFCPSLPGCGIWRPVRLEGIDKAAISDVHVRTVDCNESYADVRIAVKLRTSQSGQYVCRLNLRGGREESEHRLLFSSGEDFQSTLIRIDKPTLWWPAGYGRQNLYELQAGLYCGGQLIDQADRQFGIRTTNLILQSEKDPYRPDKRGKRNFELQVNGQSIAVRGANWIPASMFPGSVTSADYEELLATAREANMNMLRVWGGGYYEDDRFYDICDKLGILVWQDFMFACAYYPDRQWFLNQVKAEAQHVVRRLRNHSSLVLWCGNNEIDWLHHIGELGKGKKFYGSAIYHKLLPQIVKELDGDTDYIPTTPLGTKEDFKTAKTLTKHQWQIWSGHKPVRDYLCRPDEVPPFVTEFGMQSLPCSETITESLGSAKNRPGDKLIEKHNYQVDGNGRIYRYVGDLFGAARDTGELVYLSQITQARGVKTYVEHLRAHRHTNKGVMFWQFNDCNPAISWSAIDFARRPKAVYYYARRFFADIFLAVMNEPEPTKAGLSNLSRAIGVAVVNDSSEPLTATLSCRIIDMHGNQLDLVEFPISVGPLGSTAHMKLPKAFLLPEHPETTAMHVVLNMQGKVLAQNLFLYLPDKYIDWPAPKITVTCRRADTNKWKVLLKSEALARDVMISGLHGECGLRYSDNFVDLVPPFDTEITMDCKEQTKSTEPILKITSVNDVLRRATES